MRKHILFVLSTFISLAYANAQSVLEFKEEIRAPDNWELVLEYHTPSKVITSKVMEFYRLNAYGILKSEHVEFCKCNWVDTALKLDVPITAAYIPRGFEMNCSDGRRLISQLKKFHDSQEDTQLIGELKRLWKEYGNSSTEFEAMLYDTRIFMRLSENFDIPTHPATKHLVRDGETLYRLSVKYNVSIESIQQANNLGGSTSIQSGSYIIIPN